MNYFLRIVKKPEIRSIATLSGTIIGVGIFGLPYVFQKTGIILGIFLFFLIFFIVFLLHYIYGLISIENGRHRLVFYVERYLGKKYSIIPIITSFGGIFATLIAYALLGGKFLANVFRVDSPFLFELLYIIVGVILIYFGLTLISWIELIFIILTAALFFIAFIYKAGSFNLLDFNFINNNFSSLFLFYGVSMFSLIGLTSIPESAQLLIKEDKINKLGKSIFYGTFLPVIFYIIFVVLIVGLSHGNVSQDSITNLQKYISGPLIIVVSLFGFFATFTSFLAIGSYMHELMHFDLKIKKTISILLLFLIPFLAILTNATSSYLKIISFVGGVFIGVEAILILLIYNKNRNLFKEKYNFYLGTTFVNTFIVIFFVTILYELLSFIFNKA